MWVAEWCQEREGVKERWGFDLLGGRKKQRAPGFGWRAQGGNSDNNNNNN